jgi:hypothetical protein
MFFFSIGAAKKLFVIEKKHDSPILCCFSFSFGFIFIQMDHIASNVLTAPIEKNMIFTIFLYSHKLALV